jgi:hypothetical protein
MLSRKLIVPLIAAGLLTGSPAAFAATSATAGPAHSTAVDAFKWLYWDSYPTLHVCQQEGDYIVEHVNNGYIFKCIEYTEGDYFIWKLYIGVPE